LPGRVREVTVSIADGDARARFVRARAPVALDDFLTFQG
jgi:class 3 adenylate cyclase